ncbi:hypothetical protein J6590_023084 [Homalodisca vitripennis]|nr:hypothetical protein J6590_023084 [Homalodisca vitripennis]
MQIEQGEIPVVSSLLGQGMRAKTEGDRISCRCLLLPIGTAFCQQMSSFPRPARRTEHIIISTESGELMSPVITRGKVHQRPRAIRLLRLRLPEEITHTADTQRKLQYVIPGWKHDMFPLCNTVRTVVEASVGKCTNKPHHERGAAAIASKIIVQFNNYYGTSKVPIPIVITYSVTNILQLSTILSESPSQTNRAMSRHFFLSAECSKPRLTQLKAQHITVFIGSALAKPTLEGLEQLKLTYRLEHLRGRCTCHTMGFS